MACGLRSLSRAAVALPGSRAEDLLGRCRLEHVAPDGERGGLFEYEVLVLLFQRDGFQEFPGEVLVGGLGAHRHEERLDGGGVRTRRALGQAHAFPFEVGGFLDAPRIGAIGPVGGEIERTEGDAPQVEIAFPGFPDLRELMQVDEETERVLDARVGEAGGAPLIPEERRTARHDGILPSVAVDAELVDAGSSRRAGGGCPPARGASC